MWSKQSIVDDGNTFQGERLKHVLHTKYVSQCTEHLKRPLDKYFRDHPKVKVLRAPARGGLIKARLLGFAITTGEVVVFFDSHIECTEGKREKGGQLSFPPSELCPQRWRRRVLQLSWNFAYLPSSPPSRYFGLVKKVNKYKHTCTKFYPQAFLYGRKMNECFLLYLLSAC